MSKGVEDSDNNGSEYATQTASRISLTKSLTGTWKANDGGTYYMHHIEQDNTVWCIGTSKEGGDRPWMVVYHGMINKDENMIDGKWAAVPLGIIGGKWSPLPKDTMRGEGQGRLRLRIIHTGDGSTFLRRMPEENIGDIDGFGGSAWELII
jgi:hypothetical protein